jgi:hypothetical protein
MLRRMLAAVMVLTTVFGLASGARATAVEPDAESNDATPPRLSYTAGSVSFWRPGGDDWAPAQVNTPLAQGDELYTAHDGNLELQIGGRAFVRAWGDTQLGLTNHDPNFLQLRVAAGHVVVDLRSLDRGDVVEVDTPAAAFTIDQPGYYRVDVTAERTSFSTRRAGRATMTTADGRGPDIAPGEAVVVEGGTVQRLAAPGLDVWDRWNDARTDALVAPVSAQHVPAQIYGVNELDRYGAWRADPTYGSVWVPAGVAPGWAPYSTGRWIWDPHFGWTWLDVAPWGWAPYHYGRWVSLGGVWAWAPGPIVVRPAYAPALVVFFGTPTVGVHVAGPSIGWVALGWGEPVVPWWGRPHFVGRPWWGGWGGPRVQHVTVYRNVTVVNAVVAVRSDHFGRRAVHETRIVRPDVRRLQPVRGRLDVKPEAVSFRGRDGHAQRPPDDQVSRRVVSTRPPVQRPEPPRARDDRREGRPDERREGRPDDRRDGRPNDRRDARPDDRGESRPGVRNDPRPDARRDGRPDPPPDVRRDAERDRRPETSRPETPRATPRRPDAPRPETPRVESPREDPRRSDVPRVEPPRNAPRRPDPPRPETPRVETPRPETPRVEPPRTDPRRSDVPRVEPPRNAPRRPDPPRPEPRVDTPRSEPRVEPRRPDVPRVEPPQGEPRRPEGPRGEPRGDRRPDAPRVEAPRGEPRRPEAPRESPRVEAPRRAAVPDAQPAPRPAVQRRPESDHRAPQSGPRSEPPEERGGQQERGRPGR